MAYRNENEKEWHKKYREKNREKLRNYSRQYELLNKEELKIKRKSSEETRALRRDRDDVNREKIREKQKNYRQKIKKLFPNRKTRVEKWNQKNKEKVKAHQILNHAIRDGIITRMPCIVCGNLKSHGHHDNYLKPLDVKWLCAKHHAHLHKGLLII